MTEPKRKRPGDSAGQGVRTVTKGRVRWGGKWYQPVPLPLEAPYDGRFEGKRIFFRQHWTGPQMWLQLRNLYDEPTPLYNPYPKWVCDDVFDD